MAAGLMAAGAGASILQFLPQLRIELFAAAAARLAASLMGAEFGWSENSPMILPGDRAIAVTAVCSGTDFFLMVAALFGWWLMRVDRTFLRIVVVSLACAVPVTVLVNALRVVAVTQAHRWLIPLLPERYGAFSHLFTGAAVFLPSLILLNLILERYAKAHYATSRAF